MIDKGRTADKENKNETEFNQQKCSSEEVDSTYSYLLISRTEHPLGRGMVEHCQATALREVKRQEGCKYPPENISHPVTLKIPRVR